jgi:hypothetical protein
MPVSSKIACYSHIAFFRIYNDDPVYVVALIRLIKLHYDIKDFIASNST